MVDHPPPGTRPPGPAPSRSVSTRRPRWLRPALVVLAISVAATAVWFVALRDGGPDDVAGEASDSAEVTGTAEETQDVIVIDEAEVDVVQNPSLSATVAGDGVRVENDGNVTMHDIAVAEGGEEICLIETLSPGDGADCQGASAGAVVAGLGPQDQRVEITVD